MARSTAVKERAAPCARGVQPLLIARSITTTGAITPIQIMAVDRVSFNGKREDESVDVVSSRAGASTQTGCNLQT